MGKKKSLLDEYRFPGFRPRATVKGIFGDPKARVIRLERTQKKRFAAVAARCTEAITTGGFAGCGTFLAGMHGFTWKWKSGVSSAGGAGR